MKITGSASAMRRVLSFILYSVTVCVVFLGLEFPSSRGGGEITVRLTSENTREDAEDELSKLLSDFYSILPSELDSDDALEDIGFSSVMEQVLSALSGGASEILSHFARSIGVCLLLALSESAFAKDELRAGMSAGISGVLSIPMASSLFSLAESVKETIARGCDFFGGLIPIATAATALSGGGTTAAAQGSAMSLALGFVSNVLLRNLLPTVSLMFAFSMVSSFDSGGLLGSAVSVIKGVFTFILGLVTFLLPATLSLQTVIASAKDSMALRSARYAIGNMIPVVGGTLSAMLSTLVSGAGTAVGTVGALSSAAIGFIFLTPLVNLLIFRLSYKICIAFLDFVGVTLGKKTMTSLMSAVDSLIAVLCMSGAIFFFETVIFMRSAVTL